MKLIVGLGNPGRVYERTRHNAGANAVAALAGRLGVPLTQTSMDAVWGKGRHAGQDVILALPTTYMNLSGQAVSGLSLFFKIPPDMILAVVDDLNLPLGKLRFREEGSAGGHNGLKSMIHMLGSQVFHRLRIGIGAPPPRMEVTDFVLGAFTAEEQPAIRQAYHRAAEAAQCWLENGVAAAMRQYNGS